MICVPYLDLFEIDLKYIRDLSKVDDNVMSQSPQIGKISRPYLGIIILVNEKQYCIPLTSAQNKTIRNNIDYIKIPHPTRKNKNGSAVIIGALNINNMIPVHNSVIKKYNLSDSSEDSAKEKQRKSICRKERAWCQLPSNTELIIKRANKVYDIVVNNPESNLRVVKRCCNFKKLEAVLEKYLKAHGYDAPEQQYMIKIVSEKQYEALKNSDIPFKTAVKDGQRAVQFKAELRDKVEALFNVPKLKR